LGIEAPRDVTVFRTEVLEEDGKSKKQGAK
jgi:sRNA-binding carbon storage regulator CsrA